MYEIHINWSKFIRSATKERFFFTFPHDWEIWK